MSLTSGIEDFGDPFRKVRELQAEVKRLTEERDHWKANHDEQVRMKRVTADYRDGFATELDHAEAENERLRALLAAKDDALRWIIDEASMHGAGTGVGGYAAIRDEARTALGATQEQYRDNRVAWSPQNPDAASGGKFGATQKEFVHPEYVGDNPVCPVCGSYEWEQGPRGGNSVNIKCKNGHWWNDCGPLGIQRIKSGATQKEETNG